MNTPLIPYSINNNGVRLHAVTLGDAAHEPIVLVHGYPDNHSVWLPVARYLADRFYVILYDVRGNGGSSRPRALSAYKMPVLASDLAAVVDALIPGRGFHLAGHDWGSIQSWESVTTAPLNERILSYTTLSGPCLDHVGFWMRNHGLHGDSTQRKQAISQLLSSWYIFMFQMPVLPPLLWKAGLGKLWPTYLRKREHVAEPDYNPTQKQDGAYGINLYRANFMQKLFNPEERYARCPIQLIVPTQDNYVSDQLFDELNLWATDVYRRDLDAGHWVLLSEPEKIAGWISEFVSAVAAGDAPDVLARLRVTA